MASDFLSIIQSQRSQPSASRKTPTPKDHSRCCRFASTVLFPHAVLPLTVGRESSIQLIQSLGEEKTIMSSLPSAMPRIDSVHNPAILHSDRHPGDRSQGRQNAEPEPVCLYGRHGARSKLGEFCTDRALFDWPAVEPIFRMSRRLPRSGARSAAAERSLLSFRQIVTASPTLSDELQTIALNIEEPGRLVDFIASSLPFPGHYRQAGAAGDSGRQGLRLERINRHLAKEARSAAAAEQDPVRSPGPGAAIATGLLPSRAAQSDPERRLGEMDEGPEGHRRVAPEDRERPACRRTTKKEAVKELEPAFDECLQWPPTTR